MLGPKKVDIVTARDLFASAMRIGRDHIASTVYTIAFAYAGAALPILIIVMLYNRPLGEALTRRSGKIAWASCASDYGESDRIRCLALYWRSSGQIAVDRSFH